MNDTIDIEVLYRQHGAALVLFASAIIGDRARAQDAVHQVFLKLMENSTLLRAWDPKGYLFASVRNAALNDIKTRNLHVALDVETVWFEPPDRDYAAEKNLQRALRAIPEDQRQIVVLHIWAELTFSQIAQIIEISPNTAASRFRYGLVKLRALLQVVENSHAYL